MAEQNCVPMCFDDYLNYWCEEAPRYLRLSKEAASNKWDLDFQRLRKEQRDANNLDGEGTGKVWILWVPTAEVKKDINFTENSVKHSKIQERKAPTEKVLQEMRGSMLEEVEDPFP